MTSIKNISIVGGIVLATATATEQQPQQQSQSRPWMNTSLTPDERADLLVKVMNLTEKLTMMHGPPSGIYECPERDGPLCNYTGNVYPNARLGIPQLKMNDGPQGFRGGGVDEWGEWWHSFRPKNGIVGGKSTQFPSGLTTAATWDKSLMHEWAQAIGAEFYDKGANVMLGPGVCIARFMRNGRNFEYGTGEDPHLGYHFGYETTRGIQSTGIIATAKHFVNNNQELGRMWVSENYEEQAQHELYYPPFEGAVAAGAGAIMCSFNKQHGKHSCGNPEVLKKGLKGELGFKGFVMTDWGAGVESGLDLGLDMEMPGAHVFKTGGPAQQAVESGKMNESVITDSVRRILRSMFQMGVFEYEAKKGGHGRRSDNVTSVEHNDVARRVSAAASVLLKNDDGVLPLTSSWLSQPGAEIAVIGAADYATGISGGGGSGHVQGSRYVSPLQTITERARTTGSGSPNQNVWFTNGTNTSSAVALAQSVKLAIVFIGSESREGVDRPNLSNFIPMNADVLVSAVAAAQPNTVVVASTPGATLMPWAHEVKAVVANFMPGQEAGSAIADILFGDVNPSGRLPLTIPNMENEQLWTGAQYPGVDVNGKVNSTHPDHRDYTEGIFFGYRWYDQHKVAPAFPFGHGLSYTSFHYEGLEIETNKSSAAAGSNNEKKDATVVCTVRATVTNSGKVAGAEVVQLYLGFPAVHRGFVQPPRVLRGFVKTDVLSPGTGQSVEFQLTARDLSTWDPVSHGWVYSPAVLHPKEQFTVYVGASSRDIRLSADFSMVGEQA